MQTSTKQWIRKQVKEWIEAAVTGTIVAVICLAFILLMLLLPSKRDKYENEQNVTYGSSALQTKE